MYEVKILQKARINILDIIKYIAEDNLFYANKVQKYIYKNIMLLGEFPFIGIKLDNTYRQIVESHYKFKIVYRVGKDTIYIVAIFREQNSWKN